MVIDRRGAPALNGANGRRVTRAIGWCAHVTTVHFALAAILVSFLPIALRLALLPVVPIPAPAIHDEFSNLLAADTFAHGRLTNPTPPSWEHFETFHELMQPTYSTVYPPGMGLFLAASRATFGCAWWGIVASVMAMSLSIIWMLRAWFAPVWAIFGGLLVGMQFGVIHYWVNGYWGGTLSAAGGALVIGAYGRLRSGLTWSGAFIFAVGAALLSLIRPYEGGVLVLTAGTALLWSARQDKVLLRTLAYMSVAFVICVLPAVLFLAAHDHAVTGKILLMPHELYRKQYGLLPSFAWEPSHPHVYRHRVLQEFFYEWEPTLEDAREWGTVRGLIPGIWYRLKASGQFVPSAVYFPLALLSLVAALWRRMRFAGVCVLTALLANGLVNWLTPHYLAPVLAAMIGIHIYFLRLLRVYFKSRRIGNYVFAAVMALLLLCFGLRFTGKIGIPADKVWAYQRRDLLRKLSMSEQRDLIFVRYSPSHDPVEEWVFNGADLAGQKVVWARYMSPDSDQAVVGAFGDRQTWLLEPDTAIRLRPYHPGSDAFQHASR